jgi:hypothetical protein
LMEKYEQDSELASEPLSPLAKGLVLERPVWKSNCAPRTMAGGDWSGQVLLNVSNMYTAWGSLNLAITASVACTYAFSISVEQNLSRVYCI